MRENFDLKLYENPVWKVIDKKKWKSPKGFSYEGQNSPHVNVNNNSPGLNRVAIAAYSK